MYQAILQHSMHILYEKLLKAYQNKGKVHQMSGKCERAAKKEIQWEFHWKIDDKYIQMVNKLEIFNIGLYWIFKSHWIISCFKMG